MTERARSLGISRQLPYSIADEKASVTPEVAVLHGKAMAATARGSLGGVDLDPVTRLRAFKENRP